ncbi:MAG: DinB family protein [Phycisphaeraceae bacterium]|nr:DinB family protein [Phycisphaerales bacterium]MCB9859265.1 DinB family protein [Phycisphaeraceae bacterium]
MSTVQFIRDSMEASRRYTMHLLSDLRDTPLVQPTVNGGNHALWIVGHLATVEGMAIQGFMLNKPNPMAAHEHLFRMGSTPSTDPTMYPGFDQLVKMYDDIRTQTYALLDTLTDADLAKTAPGCPEQFANWFGTYEKCLRSQVLHPLMHSGQAADIRLALGKERLMV